MREDYIFMPYLRPGLANLISNGSKARAKIKIDININQGSDKQQIAKYISLLGPGDVSGFDHGIIVRTDPQENVTNFESNFFPLIEFWEEAFPWVLTPTSTPDDEKLKPWINLIVLKMPGENHTPGEFEILPYHDETPLPRINVFDKNNSLPDLGQSWAWAHVQVTPGTLSADDIEILIKNNPENVISRIICPRLLEPETRYRAFLVPTFETGRLSGLGQSFADTLADKLAWDINQQPESLELPYYYSWQFATGQEGDFEKLVNKLKPQELDNRVGKRFMDVSDPGMRIPGIELKNPPEGHPNEKALEIEGALMHPQASPTKWPEKQNDTFRESLTGLLNLPIKLKKESGGETLLVTPPVYGKHHAGIGELKPENNSANSWWPEQLNLDPRRRVVASFGTGVVQANQESLMHEAWRQVGDVEQANQAIFQAQASIHIIKQHIDRKIKNLEGNGLISFTSAIHSRLRCDLGSDKMVTVKNYLGNTAIPGAAFDGSFARINRKTSGIRSKQKESENPGDLLERMNSGDIRAAGDAPVIDGTDVFGQMTERPWYARGIWWKILKKIPLALLIILLILIILIILSNLGVISGIPPLWKSALAAFVLFLIFQFRVNTPGILADNIAGNRINKDLLESVVPPADFEDAENFRQVAVAIQEAILNQPVETLKPPANLKDLNISILQAINPEQTIGSRIKKLIRINGLEPARLKPIWAYPEFPQPMYEHLRDLSQDYLLPGLEHVDENTISVLKANDSFINAYMTGLNTEMASEFRWREYPTDLKGSPFRQFWNVDEVIMTNEIKEELLEKIRTDNKEQLENFDEQEKEKFLETELQKAWKEKLKDIQPIHKWGKTRLEDSKKEVQETTGGNGSSGFFNRVLGWIIPKKSDTKKSSKESLVLLIRGELLQKYPTAVIYAICGIWDGNKNKREPDFSCLGDETYDTERIRFPVFKGSLKPDITFFGFELEMSEAKGSTNKNDGKPGWYFVIEERISETRFGMGFWAETSDLPDELEKWEDISQGHFFKNNNGTIGSNLPGSNYIDNAVLRTSNSVSPEDYSWSNHAGHRAAITCRKPVRVAIHAAEMLP